MKQNLITEREKYFLALRKRYDDVLDEIRSLPWRKLPIPIQDGWTVNLRLIDEAYRRSDGPRMAKALAITDGGFTIGSSKAGKITQIRKNTLLTKIRPYFMYTDWQGKRSYAGPYPAQLSVDAFKKVPEDLTKFFTRRERESISRWGGQVHKHVTYVLNIPEYYIGIKVKKRMLNMIKDIDPKLIRERDYLDDKLEPFYRTTDRYGRNWSDYTPKDERRHMKDAIVHTLKNEIETPFDYKKLNRNKL